MGFNMNLDSHHINHAISKNFNKRSFLEFGIELRHIINLLKELAVD